MRIIRGMVSVNNDGSERELVCSYEELKVMHWQVSTGVLCRVDVKKMKDYLLFKQVEGRRTNVFIMD